MGPCAAVLAIQSRTERGRKRERSKVNEKRDIYAIIKIRLETLIETKRTR